MIIAVDTGGTKTLVGAFSSHGRLLRTEKFPTPKDVDEYVAHLVEAIHALTHDQPPRVISLAVPGIVEHDILEYAPNIGWHDVNVKQLLEAHFSIPIVVENDANVAGLAETRTLPKHPGVVLYVTVSTGIGTGVIKQGKIDPEYRTSEGGHIVLEYNGALLQWEEFASGRAIYKRYGKYGRDITSKRAWHDIGCVIGRGIIALAPVLRPDIVIIGGSIGTYFANYGDSLNKFVQEHSRGNRYPAIVKAKHPEEAVIYGCYYHAVDCGLVD